MSFCTKLVKGSCAVLNDESAHQIKCHTMHLHDTYETAIACMPLNLIRPLACHHAVFLEMHLQVM